MRQTSKLTIGGREFLMRELTAEDHERLDEHVQGRFIAATRAAVSGLPTDGLEWRAAMALAMREATTITWQRQPGINLLLSSKRGIARMLHAGMNGGTTIDDVADALKTADDVRLAREEFMRINGLAAAKEVAAPAGGPTTLEQGG